MDAIFKAMADPARRAILDTLREEDGQTLSALTDRFEMTRFGVMKHLAVLEEAGLVTTVKKGRFKYHYLNALPLQEAIDRWIAPFTQPAARGILDLKARLEEAQSTVTLTTFIAGDPEAVHAALTAGPWDLRATTADSVHAEEEGEPLTFQVAAEGGHSLLTLTCPTAIREAGQRHLARIKTLIETGTEHLFPASPPAAPDPSEKETPK